MRPRLVFIDDDPQELDDFGPLVREAYDYVGVRWPMAGSLEEAIGPAPALFVLDMYFPPAEGGAPETIGEAARTRQAAAARAVAERMAHLYDEAADGKRLLRETFACIQGAYDLLWAQCRELEQSPETGRALLAALRSHPRYRRVPVVFYSRKVTTREAVLALAAGATAVIPKAPSPPRKEDGEWVLRELEAARAVPAGRVRRALARGLGIANFNVTVFPAPAGSNPLPPRRHADHP